MKKSFFTLILSFATLFAFSQIKVTAPNGDVGIGTTTPGGKLQITDGSANLLIKGAAVNPSLKLLDVTSGTQGSIRIGCISAGSNSFGGAVFQAWSDNAPNHKGRFYFDAGTDAAAGIFFRTSSNTRMAVLQNGRVGIGTLTPSEKLHVNGNIMAAGGLVLTSDKRLKKDVTKFKRGLKEVLQIEPISYTYNGKGGTNNNSHHIGLFAQDLQKIAPEMVFEFTHSEFEEATTEKEHKLISEEKFLAIKDTEIKYMLINAIQEQQLMLNEKDEEIAKLNDRLDAIELKFEDILNENTSFQQINISDVSKLAQNSPNPFNETTTINYSIPKGTKYATLAISNASGRTIKTIALENFGKGSIEIKAGELQSGSYSYSLIIDGNIIDTKKMVLTK